jgi:hypothetical protein
MNRNRIEWVISCILIIAGIFISCAGFFRPNEPLTEISHAQLIHRIQQHASHLRTFRGKARLTIISEIGSFRGSIHVSVKMPDSLLVKVEGPLGIDCAIGRFSGKHLLMYIPIENIAYNGSIQEIQKNSVLPLNVGFSDTFLGILGLLVPPESRSDSLLSISSNSQEYILQYTNGEKIWIKPKGPVVTRWEKRNRDNKILWSWEGKELTKNKGIWLPRIIRMINYQQKQRITLFYDTVKTNHTMHDNWSKVRLPEGVVYVEL